MPIKYLKNILEITFLLNDSGSILDSLDFMQTKRCLFNFLFILCLLKNEFSSALKS